MKFSIFAATAILGSALLTAPVLGAPLPNEVDIRDVAADAAAEGYGPGYGPPWWHWHHRP
ncbi:hypothetical protein H0H93_015502, partial [Arthromyces matolae]